MLDYVDSNDSDGTYHSHWRSVWSGCFQEVLGQMLKWRIMRGQVSSRMFITSMPVKVRESQNIFSRVFNF